MNSTEKTYFHLTGVNLDVEKRIWDERGKGYYGEYLVFKELYLNVAGNCKLLMNLHIPVNGGRTTEVDLLMIHETGIYVFEVKHYKGTIYGDSEGKVWTQYFRTAKNNVFDNPIHQNGYHIRALSKLLPDAPIYSVIVFTNYECELKIDNRNPNLLITALYDLMSNLLSRLCCLPKIYTAEQINSIFCHLAPYSPLSKQEVPPILATEASFYEYIAQFKQDMDNVIAKIKEKTEHSVQNAQMVSEQAKLQAKEDVEKAKASAADAKKHWRKYSLVFSLIVAIISICVCLLFGKECLVRVSQAESELQAMKQNFQHIDAYADEYLLLIDGMIQVSEVHLNMSPDLQNTAVFSCKLENFAEEYGIMFRENSKYIIMLKNGTVQEYDMFGERLAYYQMHQRLGGTNQKAYRSSSKLAPLEIYGICDISEIEYIKVTNITLWSPKIDYGNTPLKNGLELELYSASTN